MDRRQYAELFQMNEMELELLAGVAPRQQVLLKRPNLAKVLTLRVDPKSYWIYTNTPVDNERVDRRPSRVRPGGRHRPAGRVGLKKRSVQMAHRVSVPARRIDRGSVVLRCAARGAIHRHPRGDGDAIAASSR